ncbi:MAG: hypothetical protein M3Z21_11150 [Pseudomonadota bacterium]|nr:hypothetical protein [Pseudomonadota bacterium]
MSTLTLDHETERALDELSRATGKTPLEIVQEAVRAYKAQQDDDNETAYLLSSPANAARLLKAVEDVKHGRYTPRDLLDDD